MECALNQAVVLLMKTTVLAQHLRWPMKLDTSKNDNNTVLFTTHKCILISSLGMQHDGTNNVCGNSQRIMAPSLGGREESFFWSSCSAGYLQTFLGYHLIIVLVISTRHFTRMYYQ